MVDRIQKRKSKNQTQLARTYRKLILEDSTNWSNLLWPSSNTFNKNSSKHYHFRIPNNIQRYTSLRSIALPAICLCFRPPASAHRELHKIQIAKQIP